MKFLASIAAFAAVAIAAPAQDKGNLGVQLDLVDKTNIRLVVTNEGQDEMKLLKIGTIIDEKNPVKKVQASSSAGDVQFEGMTLHVAEPFLTNDSFASIMPGATIENVFDVAQIYDLTTGDEFSFQAKGVLSIADASGRLAGAIPYLSNTLKTRIDSSAASASRYQAIDKRVNLQSDCTGNKRGRVNGALTDAFAEAYYARQEALYGPADRMNEYFKRSDSQARQIVGDVYQRVMGQCRTGSGADFHCTTAGNGPCDAGVLAYTVLPVGIIYMCDAAYTLSNKNRQCHGYALADTIIHEMTHLPSVKGTDDNAYGYDGLRQLGSAQALNNADTYDFFSQSIWGDCPGQSKRWQVYTCMDSNFGGQCFGVQGFLHSCSRRHRPRDLMLSKSLTRIGNVPPEFNDKISSVGSSYLANCSGYKDANCQGQRIDFGNGQQLNTLPGDLNDQLTSFYC